MSLSISLLFKSFLGLMPSVCEDKDNFGVKLVTFFPNNMDRYGVQTHNAVIILLETRTGIPKAVRGEGSFT